MNNKFSASKQNLGYLYQSRIALLLMFDKTEDYSISIETLDDIVFENDGTLLLGQVKHHDTAHSLSDLSTDLWKTLRVWIENWDLGVNDKKRVHLLFTTSAIKKDSAPFFLQIGDNRNVGKALELLEQSIEKSKSEDLAVCFGAFRGLDDSHKNSFLKSVYIQPDQENIEDIPSKIKFILGFSVRRENVDKVYERLEGWWYNKIIKLLKAPENQKILGYEIRDKVASINEQFSPESLPIDFLDKHPPNKPDPSSDNRIFVKQLHEIKISNRRIEKAIVDYYRAFEQRSKWAREDLLIGDELEMYERKLVDEWERQKDITEDDMGINSSSGDDELVQAGKEIYKWIETVADVRIRENVREEYVMRGSYHILADSFSPRVWWHPQFLSKVLSVVER